MLTDLQNIADRLLEQIIYCDFRTDVGTDEAKKLIRQALRDATSDKRPEIDQ